MKKCYLAIITIIATVAGQSIANPPQPGVLSNNRNTGACQTTDTAGFKLESPARVNTVKTWYNTNIGGDNLQFKLMGDQGVITSGAFAKAGCDPYQGQWCEGVTDLKGRVLAAGWYAFKTEAAAICENAESGGNGVVEVGGTIEGAVPPTPSCDPNPATCTNPFGEGCCVKIEHMVPTNPNQ